MTGARPGWYPDPGGHRSAEGGAPRHGSAEGGAPRRHERFRWWSGSDWTDAVSDSAQAPEPSRSRAVRAVGYGRGRSKTAWSLGLALLAVAGVVLGLVIWHDPIGLAESAAAGATARPSASGVPGELDQASREARIGAASMRMPEDPYVLRADPMRVKNLFDSYFAASATVHEDYDRGQDWSVLVGLAHVAPEATRNEVEATAVTVAEGIVATFFDGRPTTVEHPSVAEHAVDGCSGYVFTADVRYRIPELASTADELTVLVVRLDDGTRVAAFASVPTDAPEALRAQAAASLTSLQVG